MKIARQNLRTPGPTPVPDDIVEAMSNPMINHRGPEFLELLTRVTGQLKQVFMTANDLYILTASGTGSLEASIVNTLSPGDKVLSATAGAFGDRFTDIAAARFAVEQTEAEIIATVGKVGGCFESVRYALDDAFLKSGDWTSGNHQST